MANSPWYKKLSNLEKIRNQGCEYAFQDAADKKRDRGLRKLKRRLKLRGRGPANFGGDPVARSGSCLTTGTGDKKDTGMGE